MIRLYLVSPINVDKIVTYVSMTGIANEVFSSEIFHRSGFGKERALCLNEFSIKTENIKVYWQALV